MSAQTFLSEDFSSGSIPPGWTIDAHSANWSVESSNDAGGAAPELQFYYNPTFNGASRLISPVIDMTGFSSATLIFKHFLDFFAASQVQIGVATRSGGGAWNTVWSANNPTANIGPEQKMFEITNSDMGAEDFQFCFYFTGYSYNLDAWFIDNIMLFVPYNLDVRMNKIDIYKYCTGAVPVEGEILNLGLTAINSVDISWKSTDDITYTTTFDNLTVEFLGTFDFSCNDLFSFSNRIPCAGCLDFSRKRSP